MSIKVTSPKTEREFFNAGFYGILAILETINPTGPNIPNVLSNLKSGFASLAGQPEDTVGTRAWCWAFKTLSYALGDFLKAEHIKAPLSKHKDEAVREFLSAAVTFNGKDLDGLTLMNPGLSPMFTDAHNVLKALILKATTGHELEVETITERFNQALRTGSNRSLCEDPTYFRVLEDALTGIAGEGARRDTHWARHAHWISHQFTDAPIFSPDEEEIVPLEAVYLPLRCFWHEKKPVVDEDENEETIISAHIADLHSQTSKWLSADARKEPLRVIAGGPGSGKSSFARAFAHKVIQEGKHRVLFVRLQFASLTGSLAEDIARYCNQYDNSVAKNGNPGIPGNPLDWRKQDPTPIVMIFDGLDELSTNDDEGNRYAREFLLALKLMLSPLNVDGSPVRAMILGRNIACQSAMKAANIPLKAMLNVAPIAQLNSSTCSLSSTSGEVVIRDPSGLKDQDQRPNYWQKWARLKGINPAPIPEALTSDKMSELNLEPLLLHLLIISRYSGEDWKIAAKNKNIVYEDILEKIFVRNKEKEHFLSAGIDNELFFSLMECLGIAAWRGNGRTGGEDEFRSIRKLHLDQEKKFKNFPAANLKSVALNIHTRVGEDDSSSGFEFIHKSFGEYLAARGLLSHALKVAAVLENKEAEDVEQAWCQLIGEAELTNEIVKFLYDEATRILKVDTALPAKNALTELIDWAVSNGFSVHKSAPELSWKELQQRQRCASSSLVAATSAVATAIPLEKTRSASASECSININWPSGLNSTMTWLNNIGVTTERSIHSALQRLNLSDQHLWNVNFSRANLSGANLADENLIWGLFFGTNLEGAYLKEADLSHSQISYSRLRNVCLIGAELRSTTFKSTDMVGCDLSGANLENAVFRRDMVSIRDDLNSPDLDGYVDFQDTILREAKLEGADLSSVRNLTLDALNSAIGDMKTILPEYIDRSKVYWPKDS
ncbi:MAG: pentapeptide repeat-containing protein [Paracoccaceae bacterium]